MTTFFLIRHGANDLLAKAIAGRMPGVHLNAEGRKQAEVLAEQLSRYPVAKIFSSPLERARETAEPLAKRLGQQVEIADPLLEVDFGDWTGKSFADLNTLPLWTRWNTFRSCTQIPNGETISAVQARMVAFLQKTAAEFPNHTVAIFSHGDPIRCALAYFIGVPLDFLHRLEINPASLSILQLSDWHPKVTCLNRTF